MRCFWQSSLVFGLLTLFVFCILTPLASAGIFTVPPNQGYVTDTAQILSPEAIQKITAIATELDSKTHSQIAILTVPTLQNTPIEDASLQVARTWGIGYKGAASDKGNRGLLILVALNDHQMRIEVGYGLESVITDGTAGQIRDEILRPAFRQQQYDSGLIAATAFIADRIAKENQVTLTTLQSDYSDAASENANPIQRIPHHAKPFGLSDVVIMLVLLAILFFIVIPILSSMGPLGSALLLGSLLSGGGFGGGDDNDSGGGGFGGFGGGGFGGGGSSGSW